MANQNIKINFTASFNTSDAISKISALKKQLQAVSMPDSFAPLAKQITAIEAELPKLQKYYGKEVFNESEANEYIKLLQKINGMLLNLPNELGEITPLITKEDQKLLDQYTNGIKEIEKEFNQLEQEAKKSSGFTQFLQNSKGDQSIENLAKKWEKIATAEELATEKAKEYSNVNKQIEALDYSQLIQDEANSLLQLKGKRIFNNDIAAVIQQISGTKQQLTGKDVEGYGLSTLIRQIHDVGEESEEGQKLFEKFLASLKELEVNKNIESDYKKSIEDLEQYRKKIEQTAEAVERLIRARAANGEKVGELQAAKASNLENKQKVQNSAEDRTDEARQNLIDFSKKAQENIKKEGEEIGESAKKAEEYDLLVQSLDKSFGSLTSRIESSISALQIFNKSMQIVRKAVNSVQELDAAFTQIAIVSGQTNEQAWDLFESFNKLAKQYSITTKDLTEGAKLFYQQGLNSADTMKMVEASTVSAALGEVSMAEAANTLTAAIQGYNESAEVAMDYTDKIAQVGAVSAADFNELSLAMEKTASSAYTAGIDFDHLLGYLGKMIEVTREAPANLGTAMKTIIARFEDLKKSPTAILEDGVDANKVETALRSVGIALRDSSGDFRELQDVMDELGMKWQSLSRNEQAYIATIAAGSRQQSRFLALMNNYDRTLELVSESQNSAGAAAEQYTIYQDSVAAALNRLSTAWEEFYSHIVDNDAIIQAINGLTKLVEILSEIPPQITVIGTLLGSLSLQRFITDKGGITGIIANLIKTDKESISESTAGEVSDKILGVLRKSIKKKIKESKIEEMGFGKLFKSNLEKDIDLIGSFSIGGKIEKLTGSFSNLASKGITKVTAGFKALGAVIAAHPILTIGVTLSAALILIAKAAEDARKKLYEEPIEDIKNLTQEINTLKEKEKNANEQLKVYDDLSNKLSLSEEEQNKLNASINQIKELYPEAITYVDEYGNTHLLNADKIREETKALKEQEKEKEKERINAKRKVLESDPKYWKQEDFSAAGFSEAETNAIFANKDVPSIDWLRDRYNKGGAYNKVFDIDNINKIIEYYGLGLNLLNAQEATWEDINNSVGQIFELLGEEPPDLFGKTLDNVEKNLIIDESFLNVDTRNAGQSQILNILQGWIRGLSTEEYTKYFGNLSEVSLNAFISNFENEEKAVEFASVLTNYFKGKNTLEAVKQAGLAGDMISAEFYASLNSSWEKEREKFNKKYKLSETGFLELDKEKHNINYFSNLDDFIQNNEIDTAGWGNTTYLSLGNSLEDLKNQSFQTIDEINQYAVENVDTIPNEIVKGIMESEIDKAIAEKVAEGALKARDSFKDTISDLLAEIDPTKPLTAEDIDKYSSWGLNLAGNITKNEKGDLLLDERGQEAVRTKAQEQFSKNAEEAIKNLEEENKLINENIDSWTQLGIMNLEEAGQRYALNERNIDYYKRLLELQSQDLKGLEEAIDDYKKIKDLVDGGFANSQSGALQFNADLTDEYRQVLSIVDDLKEQMRTLSVVSDESMNSLLQYGDAFYQYFHTAGNGELTFGLNESIESYEQAAEEILAIENKKRQANLEIKKQELYDEAKFLDAKAEAYTNIYNYLMDAIIRFGEAKTEEEKQQIADEIAGEIRGEFTSVKNAKATWDKKIEAADKAYEHMAMLDAAFWKNLGKDNIQDVVHNIMNSYSDITLPDLDPYEALNNHDTGKLKKIAEEYKNMGEALREQAASLRRSADSLKLIDPQIYDQLAEKLDGTGSSAKEAGDNLDKLADMVKSAADAVKDLDDQLDELIDKLLDISADYTPFLDLFEEWEHEWEKFYNIRRLMEQLEQESSYINNIISNSSSSGDQLVEAYRAQIGNLVDQMGAANAYILFLRNEMSNAALELKENFGEYFQIGENDQIYRHDSNLQNIDNAINEQLSKIYELKKQQNELENSLSMKNGELNLHEEALSEYEAILDKINSQLDNYESHREDIANYDEVISKLNPEKIRIESNITLEKNSVRNLKQEVRDLEDDLDDLKIKIQIEENTKDELEKYVSDMEDLVSEYESYYDELISTIQQQQLSANELVSIQDTFVQTAIDVQKQIYSAIVESYQKEIDAKKKEYDELKKLDQEYLASVRKTIEDERKARDEAKTQKSYQQNLQRAQLLQMDTSGAYTSKLTSLQSQIENQKESMYDDMVDKQIAALENEVEKRAELYDKEVAALEERLAYYEENSILLWEQVNEIFLQGSTSIMSLLQNTAEYLSENELAKSEQRDTWERDIAVALEGTTGEMIDILDLLIEAANSTIIETYPEIQRSLDNYNVEFQTAAEVVKSNAEVINSATETIANKSAYFSQLMDNFMAQWQASTEALTGYTLSWEETVQSMKENMAQNLQALTDANTGSIEAFKEQTMAAADALYNDILKQKRDFADMLESQINEIRSKISAAIEQAANAISSAAAAVRVTPSSSSPSGGGSTGGSTGGSGSTSGGSSTGGSTKKVRYKVYLMVNGQKKVTLGGYNSQQKALAAAYKEQKRIPGSIIDGPYAYKKGGLANYTGPAWLDGTKSAPERILSPKQTALFEAMVNSLEKNASNSTLNGASNSSYNIGDINTSINVSKLDNQTDISQLARQVEKEIVKTVRNKSTVSLSKGV